MAVLTRMEAPVLILNFGDQSDAIIWVTNRVFNPQSDIIYSGFEFSLGVCFVSFDEIKLK